MKVPIIALLTDFRETDVGVGVMKGVILSICPEAKIIDLCHEIPPRDITRGSILLRNAITWFPAETIFVAVVDPGVGGGRGPLVVKAGEIILVGPDNGLLELPLQHLKQHGKIKNYEAYIIKNKNLCIPNPTDTFDGRDVFAPVAAHLAKGFPLNKVGPKVEYISHLDPYLFNVTVYDSLKLKRMDGRIISIDRFGNCMTNIEKHHIKSAGWQISDCVVERPRYIQYASSVYLPISNTFSDVEEGQALAYFGSWGFLELAINGESAAEKWGVRIGYSINVYSERNVI